MAGDSADIPRSSSTGNGDEKSTRKRLQRTLTRILSIRRPSKEGKSAPTTPGTEQRQPTLPVPTTPGTEQRQPTLPVPPTPSSETTKPPTFTAPAPPPPPPPPPPPKPSVPEQKEPEKPQVIKRDDRETIPIKIPGDKKEGPPPPALSRAERAQALFKKHGLDIALSDWPFSTRPQGERVHKEIRMRIHRTCHKCNTGYGPEKVCVSCGHRRCKQCPRMPIKKSPQDKGKYKEGSKPVKAKPKKSVLTMPNPRGGPDLVRKPIRQRVHRNCHRCSTQFGAEKICTKCKHTRCKKCPRDPFKKSKPQGYYDGRDPSDSEKEGVYTRPRRVYRKKKMRVHWVCNKCQSTFEEHNRTCRGCGSNRDDVGTRHPPKRNRNPNTMIPSDSEIERIQQQLQATNI